MGEGEEEEQPLPGPGDAGRGGGDGDGGSAGDGQWKTDDLSRQHAQFRMENAILSDYLTEWITCLKEVRSLSPLWNVEVLFQKRWEGGVFGIIVIISGSIWEQRLMTLKGGDQFHLQLEALEEDIRKAEDGHEARRASRASVRMLTEDGTESFGRDSKFGSSRQSRQGFTSVQTSYAPEFSTPLSSEEKSEIAEDECAAVKLQIARYTDESERILDDLKAVIDETELSIGEIKKEKNSFQREVMFEAEIRNSETASSDRILSYIEDKLRAKQLLISKLQEKNDLLQAQITDAEHQLTSKKDLADILHAVDFDQLTIQNQQLMNKIRDKTHEFHRMKGRSNKALQALELVQKNLQNLQAEGTVLKQKLNDSTVKLNHVKEDVKSSNIAKKKLKDLLDVSTQESDGPPPPNALEYMQLKEAAQRLNKEVERWKKKVEVAQLTSAQLEKHMKNIPSDGNNKK